MEGFMVDVLIANGASVHVPDFELWTPLHFATHTKQGEAVIDALLEAEADVFAVDIWGCTPLYNAVRGGNLAVCQKLLDAGSDPAAVAFNGWDLLHCAAANRHEDVYLALLKAGADPTSKHSGSPNPNQTRWVRSHGPIMSCLEEHLRDWRNFEPGRVDIARGIRDIAVVKNLMDGLMEIQNGYGRP